MLQAFADGVNAAMKHESTPVEFRMLDYDMTPWRPQDSLAVSFATVLDLTDDWNDIAARIGNEPPLTDPCLRCAGHRRDSRTSPIRRIAARAARAGAHPQFARRASADRKQRTGPPAPRTRQPIARC